MRYHGLSIFFLAALITLSDGHLVWAQQPELVSINQLGNNSGNYISGTVTTGRSPGISDDGRWVTFESRATDLVALPDPNGDTVDIFVRDMLNNQTTVVSANSAGAATCNSGAHDPVISGDGCWVAFVSAATDLVAEDTSGGHSNVFLRDVVAGTTYLASAAYRGGFGGNDDSASPIVSRDGRWVIFKSEADDLVDLPDANTRDDLFAWDRITNTVHLITTNSAGTAAASGYPGTFAPTLADPLGQFVTVVFASTFTDIVANDNNGVSDVFRRTLPGGSNQIINGILANGDSTYPLISSDGGWVAFTSHADNLVGIDLNLTYDCFVDDGAGIILVSSNAAGTDSGNDHSACAGVNGNRGFVVFKSPATNLVATDSNLDDDIFIRQVRTGQTSLVSANASGTDSANNYSLIRDLSIISSNGRFVVFESFATDIESINSDTAIDVYVRDHCLGTTTLMDPNLTGAGSGNNESDHARLSRDGRWVVFSSRATNLDSTDNNGWIDTFRSEVPNWGDWGCGDLSLFSDGFEDGTMGAWSTVAP